MKFFLLIFAIVFFTIFNDNVELVPLNSNNETKTTKKSSLPKFGVRLEELDFDFANVTGGGLSLISKTHGIRQNINCPPSEIFYSGRCRPSI